MPVHVCHIVLIRYTAGETADLHILVFTQNGEEKTENIQCAAVQYAGGFELTRRSQ